LKTLYFNWLVKSIGRGHRDLVNVPFLEFLHHIPYRGILPNDENREEDGKYLRYSFSVRNNQPGADDILAGPCSMLEMLIGLAKKLEFTIAEGPTDRTAQWFWMFVNNLKLMPQSGPMADYRNKEIIDRFINREYEYSGRGGLFPLEHPKEDQREVEIWYQMMAYAEENNI